MTDENDQSFAPPPSGPTPISVNLAPEAWLHTQAAQLEEALDANVVSAVGRIDTYLEFLIRDALEWRNQQREIRSKLVVMLETAGGYVEQADRIVTTLRSFYREVDFIIPNYAFSAGTVLVMSGNEIYMDYFSVLGPIDPQIQVPGHIPGQTEWVSASGFLVWYDRLVEKARKGTITTAELQLLLEKFHPAEMYSYEQARNLSHSLVHDWLTKYKFASEADGNGKAKDIAGKLSDTDRWLSHGRGIPLQTLNAELGLGIQDLRQGTEFRDLLSYWQYFINYAFQRNHYATGAVHVNGRYAPH